MTKSELITAIADKANCSKKDATSILDSVLSAIEEGLVNGEKVSIMGFGTFEVRERSEKTCVNPRTKEKMVCPPSKTLKDAVNK